jgi:hypothetical protein
MAGETAIRIVWEDNLSAKVAVLPVVVNKALNVLMQTQAPRVQSYARSHAPWNDQTGNARSGLFARAGGGGGTSYIELYHTVPYGIFLETRWGGRYQVLVPTITAEGARIMGMAKSLIATMA